MDQFVSPTTSRTDVTLLVGALVVTVVCATFFGYQQQVTMHALGLDLRNAIRVALYRTLLNRPLSFHRDAKVGELSALASEELAKVQPLFSGFVAPLFQNSLFVIGCLVLMGLLNWPATLLVLGVMAIPLPYVILRGKKLPSFAARSQQAETQANAFFEESLVAVREIKAFLRESAEVLRYGAVLGEAARVELQSARIRVATSQAIYFLLSTVILAIFFAASHKLLFPGWTAGGIVAFYAYAYMMTLAAITAGRILLTYQGIAGALDRIMTLMEAEPATVAIPEVPAAMNGDATLRFREVTFGYSDRDVLNSVSFTIPSGAWTLVTGPSGSGKSTVASLIMGFYEPRRGKIFLGGTEITTTTIPPVRRRIGYVGQDPFLMHGTLRENIAFSEGPVDEERMHEVLAVTCLDEMVRDLPHGLETVIGERGYTLSGGQKARVAIARALLHRPEILILDEANAMLEPELEVRLWERLRAERGNQTTIIFTHHTERVPAVALELVLHNGTVEERMAPVPGSQQ